mgnify:CR=1 FL=1
MSQERRELDGQLLTTGILYGFIIGGITALFTLPKSGLALRREVRERFELAVPRDPVADSIAEGKAAARRRLESHKD